MDWKGRNVLVTGGASFIGSHLVDALIERGACVRVVDDLSSGRLANLQRHLESGRVQLVQADLRDPGVAHDCGLGEPQFAELVLPGRTPDGQPAAGLKFGQPRVIALLAALCLFGLTPEGITNRRLRPQVAALLGASDAAYAAHQMGYDLRRLARKGLIARVDGRLRYALTAHGRRVALFLTKLYARVLRPGFQALDRRIASQVPPPLRTALAAVDSATETLLREARLAA